MKIGIPKGFRDFSPAVMAKRNFIYDTIKESFKRYGYEQIETPTMENRETLTGKYGEEGDRLIFSVLNSGDYLNKADADAIQLKDSVKVISSISEKALRYDLTVPFARYVVQHQNEIVFPFKRFQIQPVWRADRPQRGRYREFYQCDADVIGSDSLINEVELIQIFDEVLTKLGLSDFSIKINNRKILSGIAEVIGRPEKIIDITVAIDKLEKIGIEKVKEELATKGLTKNEIDLIQPLFELKGEKNQVLNHLKDYLKASEIGLSGIEELQYIFDLLDVVSLNKAKVELDVTLARGLNYYTGAIFEVISNEVQMGSICGGGRYADLTGIFGLKDMSGVGISFGADRIFDVMDELNLFPKQVIESSQVLFINFGVKESAFVLPILQKMRALDIRAEIYPDTAKMKKQLKYADQKQIPYVVLVGEQEMESGELTLKNMESGDQINVTVDQLIKKFSK